MYLSCVFGGKGGAACPTFCRSKWLKLEKILKQFDVVPIIAVVPSNLDPLLRQDKHWPRFWNWIKERQDIDGWIIAVHGYNHVAENANVGILGINKKSEFSGIEKSEKIKKISKAIKIFQRHGLNTDFFVAPYHSFDFQTLKVLRCLDFKFVSDGPGSSTFSLFGLNFVPQQLWKYKTYSKCICK